MGSNQKMWFQTAVCETITHAPPPPADSQPLPRGGSRTRWVPERESPHRAITLISCRWRSAAPGGKKRKWKANVLAKGGWKRETPGSTRVLRGGGEAQRLGHLGWLENRGLMTPPPGLPQLKLVHRGRIQNKTAKIPKR